VLSIQQLAKRPNRAWALLMPSAMVRRRRLPDVMIAIGSISTVVAGTAVMSEDARVLLGNLISKDPTELNALLQRGQAVSHEFFRWAEAYRADNAPMVGFTVFALILTFLMFKT